MKKSVLSKLFAFAMMSASVFAAQAVKPEAGKIYRIVNKSYGLSMADSGPDGIVGCSEANDANMSQRWLVSAGTGSNLVFQSIGTGRYLTSPHYRSSGWTVGTAKANMNVFEIDGNYAIKAAGDSDDLAAHCDASHNVVCWTASITPSQWDFEEITMTQAEIDDALKTLENMQAEVAKESEYAAKLEVFFSDKACTTLKSSYQSMSDTQLKANSDFAALSETLQEMILKTKNGNWAESYTVKGNNIDWDSEHAKKYRVQMYEPYGEGSVSANLAGIQAYTNMNNPTGIIGNTGDVLYVMVEGEIKDGATLYMGSATGYGMFNDCTSGVELHEGLNLVPIWSDMGHQFIYYTVNTCDWATGDQTRAQLKHKLSEFDDLKIHIEGGQVNGFFSLYGDALYTADTDEDFRYTSVRAQHPMYDMLGKYVILHFFLFDTKASTDATSTSWGLLSVMDPEINTNSASDPKSYSMTTIMKEWDDMCFRERTLMGIQSDEELAQYNEELLWNYYEPLTGDAIAIHPDGDTWNTDPGFQYSDYFNNRMMGITMQGSLYMNATSWRTAYNISTLSDILTRMPTQNGAIWGPAHEYGHMNQQPMKMAGTTEESNNIFSNVAVYYQGRSTSRADKPIDQLNIFNQDLTYLEHSTWGTTRMFLQLWCYYHAAGNNKKFYPRLYELLRNNPRQQSYYLNMRYDQCHFAKICCIAAQEDLTDFFDSWGFFVPLENYHIGDYSNFYATLTEEDIKAVKDEIAALNLPKNKQIILIDDRPGSTRASWTSTMAISLCGKFGGIEDFRNKVKPSGTMSCTVRNDSLVVTGSEGATPGVGFLVYHEDGTLLGFTNDWSCPLKKAATAAMMTGKAKIIAIGAEGTELEVTNDYLNSPIEEHLSNLQKLVETCKEIAETTDETRTKVGYYIPSFIKSFLAAYDAAKAATTDNTKEEIATLYLALLDEYNAVMAQTVGRVPMVSGSIFKVRNARFTANVLAATTKAVTIKPERDYDDEYQSWEITESNGKYRLYNLKYEKYIGVDDDNNLTLVEKVREAALFGLTESSPGKYLFVYDDDERYCLHTQGDTGLGTMMLSNDYWDASKWILEIKEMDEDNGAKASLSQLIDEAQIAYDEAGYIYIANDPVDLNADMFFSNAKSYTGSDAFSSFDVLIDNDYQTYFHTITDGDTEDGLDHYLGVDLGEGNSLTSFQVSLSNRDTSRNGEEVDEDEATVKVNNPINMHVDGSNDGTNYTRITDLVRIPSTSANTYASDVLTDGNAYRYIRLTCYGSSGRANGHFYFCLSEFGIGDAHETAHINSIYPAVTEDMLFDVREQITAATKVLSSGKSASDYNKAYNALLEPYNVLAAAMGIETVIDEITLDEQQASGAAAQGIYDLQGRRVNKAGKGVYIINGVKTLVK